MRAGPPAFAACAALLCVCACIPDTDKQPEWRKPPKSWNPKAQDLSFGEEKLAAFNSMSKADRKAHAAALSEAAGTFRGQANFQRLTELGETIDDSKYGKYEAFATVSEPVLYEITIDYQLFADEPLGQGFAPGTPVEFSGTLVGFNYRDQAKPRKLELKVKDIQLNRLED